MQTKVGADGGWGFGGYVVSAGKRQKDEKRVREDPEPIRPAGRPGESDRFEALVEAYKKHAEELRAIEDRQNKTIALVLGILGAAGTLLIKGVGIGTAPKVYVSMLSFGVVLIGNLTILELHNLRKAVRDLLVRCEIAFRFYEVGAFLEGKKLYNDYELKYPDKGAWMWRYYVIVWPVWLGFILLLVRGESLFQAVK